MVVYISSREVINVFTFAELEIIQNALKSTLNNNLDDTTKTNTETLISKIDGMYLNKEVF